MNERFDSSFIQAHRHELDGVLIQMLGGASAATLDREACIRLRAVLDAAIGDGWRTGTPEKNGRYQVTRRVNSRLVVTAAYWSGLRWYDDASRSITSRVVAYRPLPEPWGGKE